MEDLDLTGHSLFFILFLFHAEDNLNSRVQSYLQSLLGLHNDS